jgi:competence protein ComEC
LWVSAKEGLESSLKLSFPKFDAVEELRAKFLFNLSGVTQDSAGLVGGLAIGERGLISEALAENMKELSLTHLVAVSGANLAIIAAAVFLTASLLGFGRSWRFALSYIAIACYIVLVGPESSVLRAGAMAAFVLAGWWLGRKVHPLIPLSWAVLLLLLIDPGLAVDIGFALSAFATLGLLLLAGRLHEWLEPRIGTWLSIGVSASIAAQLFTLPVLLILQPSIPLYSVLANLAVELVVAPVTVLGILAVLASAVFPPLAKLLSLIASFGTWWIEVVANQLSQLPLTRVPMLPGPIGVWFTVLLVLGLTMLAISKLPPLRLLGAIFVSVFVIPIAWVATDLNRQSSFHQGWEVLNCDVGQGDALLIRSQGQIALIDVGRDDEQIDNCLKSLGIVRLDLLVLTHFDADHVGGIAGAMRKRTAGLVLISGFKDDRPLVSLVSEVLASSADSVQIGHRGMSGEFGGARWSVLSPTSNALEAEDSNDASVVMTFDLQEFSVLALGDLGEPGQQRLLRHSWPQLWVLREKPLVLKVAHHGSKDQSEQLHELIQPDVAIFSVGQGNDYGHPSPKTLSLVYGMGAKVLRSDSQGPISIRVEGGGLVASTGGKLSL